MVKDVKIFKQEVLEVIELKIANLNSEMGKNMISQNYIMAGIYREVSLHCAQLKETINLLAVDVPEEEKKK